MLVLGKHWVRADEEDKHQAARFAFTYHRDHWRAGHLNQFLELLDPKDLLALKQSLQLLPPDATVEQLHGKERDVHEILKQLLWVSSHWVSYYTFRSEWWIDYHGLVQWCAQKIGVEKAAVNQLSTFQLERKILEKLFEFLWDKLNEQQRMELLCKLDKDGCIKDKAAMVALTGAAALTALSTTVILSGFAFYTTMSTVICTVAGFFGITLPFGVYMTASSTVAFLTGPVGWVVLAVLAAVCLAWLGGANAQKTIPFVIALHCIKVEHLQAAGYKPNEIF
jgi:uncharacterized protein YaaW (UPF0174 family)